MSNPLERFGVSDADIMRAIAQSAEVDSGVNDFMENQVVPYGRSVSPVDEGRYAASWKVQKKAKGGQGVVGPTDYKAWWIEVGTGEPGPTKAQAPVQKTCEHFGGDLTEGFSAGESDG